MTDLLDQLADVNPVPACAAPSIEDVWRKLDAPGEELIPTAPIPRPRGGGRISRGMHALPALVAVAVSLAVVVIAVTGPRSRQPHTGADGSSRPAWNATDGQRPSLSALMAHFAVLRRPPTAADRAAVRRFSSGVGTPPRTQAPELVRLAGAPNGIPVYFVIFADHRHGANGPIVGYAMQIMAGGGNPYAAGSYMIFPNVVSSDSGTRSEYLSVVPDGVRTVRWRFACPSNATGCTLPGGRRDVSVAVRGNLATLALPRASPGTLYANAVTVTWYRDDGTDTRYTNQNAAVPFAGAPAWPSGQRASQPSYAPGNGPLAGESLSHWRALYGVFRRPQDSRDRAAVARAASVVGSLPFVPSLTRVLFDADRTLVFMTLSAVNPQARLADRRYVAEVRSAVDGFRQPTSSQTFTPGVQLPIITVVGSASLVYSVVPDTVTKVAWYYTCSSHCGRLHGQPLVLPAHHNVAYSVITAGNWSLGRVAWYLRGGGGTPLQADG